MTKIDLVEEKDPEIEDKVVEENSTMVFEVVGKIKIFENLKTSINN